MSGINSVNDIFAPANTGITTSTAIQGKSADQMGMDDFFKLLTAQMTNQDMMDPQSNTDFIAQMAQFSSLQGMKTLQEYQLSSYAVSYVGKHVSIAIVNEQTGELERIEGLVESVKFYDGRPQVVVNGKAYELHTVMEVNVDPSQRTQTGNGDVKQPQNYTEALLMYKDKLVTLTYKDKDGNEQEITGVVETVRQRDSAFYVVIDGEEYLASASTVKAIEEAPKDEESEPADEAGETGTDEIDTDD